MAYAAILLLAFVPSLAIAKPERLPALLVSQPRVSATSRGPADLIYASLLAGLNDSLQSERRDFVEVFTESTMKDDRAHHEGPIVLFQQFTGDEIENALESRFQQAHQYRLARFLDVSIAELSPSNFEVTLRLYDPFAKDPKDRRQGWKLLADKRIGGCNETLDELAAQVREVATHLNASAKVTTPPAPKIRIAPEASQNTYLVGATLTFDSCGVQTDDGSAFNVTWHTSELATETHRRRFSLTVDHPTTFNVEQRIGTEHDTTTISVIEPPHAVPAIDTCRSDTGHPVCTMVAPEQASTAIPLTAAQRASSMPPDPSTQVTSGLSDFLLMRAKQEVTEAPQTTHDIRIIRLGAGPTLLKLRPDGLGETETATWEQVTGVPLKDASLVPPLTPPRGERWFSLTRAESGFYVFKLTVRSRSGGYHDSATIAFLAAPAVHADVGRDTTVARTNQPVLLDGSGSFDVLGDQLSMTWEVIDTPTGSASKARIIDNHSTEPRFVASAEGDYTVRLYVRVTRKLDDASIVDIQTNDEHVKVTDSDWQVFGDTYTSATTREVFRLGVAYQPPLTLLSTIARSFAIRRVFSFSAGTSWRRETTAEGSLGLAMRVYDRLQVDVQGRLYSAQAMDGSHSLSFGVGAALSQRVGGKRIPPFWFQIKVRLGPPTLYSPEAPKVFAAEYGLGIAYDLPW